MEICSIVSTSIFFRYRQQQDPAGSFCSVVTVSILRTRFEKHYSRTFLFPCSQALHNLVLPLLPSFSFLSAPYIPAALNFLLCTLLLDISLFYNRWFGVDLKHRGTKAEPGHLLGSSLPPCLPILWGLLQKWHLIHALSHLCSLFLTINNISSSLPLPILYPLLLRHFAGFFVFVLFFNLLFFFSQTGFPNLG